MGRVERVAVGRIGRPHGVHGEVRVDTRNALPRGLQGYRRVYVERDGETVPIELESQRCHGKALVVRFEGCTCPEDAARLTHSVLYVEREEMPPLAEDEYYHVDLLGCRVRDESGHALGRVSDVFCAGAHDVLVIREGSEEWMLPVVEEFVVHIDVEQGEVVVRPPPGIRA